jgi:hypothetical protein
MSMIGCERCGRIDTPGLLSAMAWLHHTDAAGFEKHVCPGCAAELNEDERGAFQVSGTVDRGL